MLNSHLKYIVRSFKGFSLVELLISLMLGSLLLAMVIGLYVTGVSRGAESLKYSRLQTDLLSIIAMLETDIRRAGYGGSDYLVGIGANKTVDINSDKNCIVFYYNHDKSQTLKQNNKMAFSLKENIIKFKSGVDQIAETVCAETSGWRAISDVQFISITNLTLTEKVTSNASVTMRSVKIALTGELTSDSKYNHSISTLVQVRNIEFH